MSNHFTHLLRVRYSECDAQQVVFNATYGEYADIAATEFFRAIWGGYDKILEAGLDNQVVDLHISWQASARFDDVLAIQVECSRIGTTSFVLSMIMTNYSTGQLITNCDITYVMVDVSSFRKTPVPDELRNSLSSGAPNVISDQSGVKVSNQ